MKAFCEITVNYKPSRPVAEFELANTSKRAADILREVWSERMLYKEEFYVLLLNTGCRALGYSRIAEGGNDFVPVNVREIVQTALMANASSLILAHNHPSGTRRPSDADRKLTEKVVECANLFDLKVLDHLILTDDSYFSFRDEGLI